VTVTVEPRAIEIVDDGHESALLPSTSGETGPAEQGNGLSGIAERAASVGGRMLAGPNGAGYRLRVEVPA
jgi:signal transduction histidine kinase